MQVGLKTAKKPSLLIENKENSLQNVLQTSAFLHWYFIFNVKKSKNIYKLCKNVKINYIWI